MNAADLATILDASEYPLRISKEMKADAKSRSLVIVYGASDDLMEFSGAIEDELGAFYGTTAYLAEGGLLTNQCEDDDCPYHQIRKSIAKTIDAVWDSEGYSWVYKTDIPHATFEVLEDGEKYCRGIVFNMRNLVS